MSQHAPLRSRFIGDLALGSPPLTAVQSTPSSMGHLGPDRNTLAKHPDRIKPSQSVWRPHKHPWKLPHPWTPDTVKATYCPGNVLENWKPGDPPQISLHRGQNLRFHCIAENTAKLAILRLKQGYLQCELDVQALKPEQDGKQNFILAHDLTVARITMIGKQRWLDLILCEVEGAPIIIRDVEKDKFKPTFLLTDQNIRRAEDEFDDIIKERPDCTLFVDANNDSSSKFTAWLSHRPRLANNIIIKFYSNCYDSGAHFAKCVDELSPHPRWRSIVKLMPILPRAQLASLAGFQPRGSFLDDLIEPRPMPVEVSTEYRAQYTAGWKYIKSILTEGLCIPSVELPICAIGERYNPKTGKAFDEQGNEVTQPGALASYLQDHALIQIRKKVRARYSHIPIGGVCRMYDYLSHGKRYNYHLGSGEPFAWPEDQNKEPMEYLATPNKAGKYIDWLNAENVEHVLQHFVAPGQAKPYQIHYPPHNAHHNSANHN